MMCDYPNGPQACSTAVYVDPTWPQAILLIIGLFIASVSLMFLLGFVGGFVADLWRSRANFGGRAIMDALRAGAHAFDD